jgi:hypothetical protein
MTSMIGAEEALTVTDTEEHHAVDDREVLRPIEGHVLDIEAVFVAFAPLHDRPEGPRYPVPGSAIRQPLDRVAGFESAPTNTRLVGYLIRIDAAED